MAKDRKSLNDILWLLGGAHFFGAQWAEDVGSYWVGTRAGDAILDFFSDKESSLKQRKRDLEDELRKVDAELDMIADGRQELRAQPRGDKHFSAVPTPGAHNVYR